MPSSDLILRGGGYTCAGTRNRLLAFSGASAFATHCVSGDYDHSKDANSSAQNRSANGTCTWYNPDGAAGSLMP